MISIYQLLRRIKPWLLAGCVVALLGTWISAFVEKSHPQMYLRFALTLSLRHESNIGTWLESLLMLACALSFVPIVVQEKLKAAPVWAVRVLQLAAVGFVFISLDESAGLHELLGRNMEQFGGYTDGTNIECFGFSWVLLYGPAAIIASIVLFKAFRAVAPLLYPDSTGRYPGAGLLYVVLAGAALLLPMELVECWLDAHLIPSVLSSAVEETIEMATLAVLLTHNLKLIGSEK